MQTGQVFPLQMPDPNCTLYNTITEMFQCLTISLKQCTCWVGMFLRQW